MIGIDPHIQLTVRDQDEALGFYTEKLGMEVRVDQQTPEFRWLTVGPAGQPDVAVVLAAAHESSPAGGGTLYLTTDDFHADYEQLKSRGVEFLQPPDELPWGIQTGLLDPSGNYVKLSQGR